MAFGRCVSATVAAKKAAWANAQIQRLALMPLDAQLDRIRQSAIGTGFAIVASTMKQARAIVRSEVACQRLELRAIGTGLREYNASALAAGSHGLASVATLPHRDMFVAMPTPHGDALQLKHIDPREWCSNALAWLAKHPRASNAASALDGT